MISFRQLQIFRATRRTGTLSAAARDLGLTQPAVSLQMKQLQAKLGTPLFRSRGRRLELTGAGEIFDGYAERILRLLDEAQSALSVKSRGMQFVRVAASSTPGVDLLPPLIGKITNHAPETVEHRADGNHARFQHTVL